MELKQNRASEIISHLAAEFLSRESNRTSLITVTSIDLAPDMGNATILITVFPEDMQDGAVSFLKRRRGDLRDYVKKNSKLRRIPRFDFAIDHGEKHRQHIDELLEEDRKELGIKTESEKVEDEENK